MKTCPRKSTFAIYQTCQGIELHNSHNQLRAAQLICTCSNYQAAQRITKNTAKNRNLPYSNYVNLF